ncbi:PREDICTED: radial spoke head 10 homolog B-like [Papilio xuthus]|uniref:Radial spoke head 10 homolog B-like n=1 Tax=Papilio xuthus TaxID=66420 RepID=A0AAJ6ZA49_PAPXU|nr:PREDICTED: radial spoke head 10 homolog B-like [Papilio xuthus]
MLFSDTPRSIATRRDSSLILSRRSVSEARHIGGNLMSSKLSIAMGCDSTTFLMSRPRGSVQKEIVTCLFNSMLDSIVESWEVISQVKKEESFGTKDFGKVTSSIFPQKKKKNLAKSKSKRSKTEFMDEAQEETIPTSWWTAPDERAIIRFRNGNLYEGNISMKAMHGDGIYIWADGTVFTGCFKDNEMNGRGMLQWKDDTWYEGDFAGNLRHGKGMYVDSRRQRSYIGEWYNGTKHGRGTIYYSETFKNSYDGQWVYNVRHGYGAREYCPQSVYEGQWDLYIREGKGLMVWPNHDFYRGEWKNGVMSGNGTYIWDTFCNNTLSQPSVIMYRGQWLRGQRHGCGLLQLGLSLGAHYTGEFKHNQKHGAGILVSNNGFILKSKQLFQDGNLDTNSEDVDISNAKGIKYDQTVEPYKFDIIDNSVGFRYHVKQAIKNIDKQQQIRQAMINKFIESNKKLYENLRLSNRDEIDENIPDDLIEFELRALDNSLRCYESDLKRIYYKYCTLCNSKKINFTPILIRLYLWQMYYDCNIHEKGLTLVQIDNIFAQNPRWLASSPHDPFEPVYYWQFIHSLISVANKLYAKRVLPGPKPDTILANAFRKFMDKDILPGVTQQKDRFINGYGVFMPLKPLYKLYQSLGEPHTLLTFIRAVHHPSHLKVQNLNDLHVESNNPCFGHNSYIFGNEITYVLDSYAETTLQNLKKQKKQELKLFNFDNLPCTSIISIFSRIFPKVCEEQRIINLNIEITFFEFFEIFIACALKSVSLRELGTLEQLSTEGISTIPTATPQTPTELY